MGGFLLLIPLMLSAWLVPAEAKYVGRAPATGSYDTGISAISDDDLNTLLKIMMNERYPVGSIYITADSGMSTPAAMASHFGGTWLTFGLQRIPVGLDTGNAYFDTLARDLGRTPGGTGGNNVTVAIAGTVNGPVGLQPRVGEWNPVNGFGNPKFSTPGFSWTTSYGATFASANIPALSWPAHTHSAVMWFGGGTSSIRSRSGGSCCRTCSGSPTGYTSRATTGTAITVSGTVGGNQAFALDINRVTLPAPVYTGPAVDRTLPGWSNPSQSITGFPLNYSLSQNAATIPDQTLQPYVTVYMYKRDTLAPVP